ncbi:MAG: radical SAM protein [Polyangiaceae bacterium]
MHVVLVGAEFEENLAVRYLRGALEHAGHRVTTVVFNEPADTERAAREIVAARAPLAGLSMVFTYRAREFARLAERARELGFSGHFTAGGHFAAMHAEQLLCDVPALDSVATSEGEPILCDLAAALDDPSRVAGLVWRRGGEVVRNAAGAKPPDLDVLPFPPRKDPFDDYLGIPITNILSSRGCKHNCAFCSIAAWHRMCGGERLRLRAPEKLADEMALLYRRGVRIFNFHDDNFVLDEPAAMLARLDALDRALHERGVSSRIAFAIKSRPDTVHEEVFARLREMGVFRVFLGIEAGTPESLRRLGRGQTLEDNLRALEILTRLDIHTCFNLLVLNPDSTLEDLAGNVAFLRAHPEHAMNFCRTEIYAGTPLERRLRKEGRLLGDYWGYDYHIADPRAQLAFEIIYPAFEARNYGDDGLHHLTMQIDYEQQLLSHFFGREPALRRRVKEQIVRVNLDTCAELEAILAAVPRLHTSADRVRCAAEAKARVLTANARLGSEVKALLDEIRCAPLRPARPKKASGLLQVAAGAGIVASLAASACREKSHPTEMVAIPTSTASGPPARDAAAPEASDAATDAEPPLGPTALVKPILDSEILPVIAKHVVPAQGVDLDLWVAADGSVSKVIIVRPRLDAEHEKAIVDAARRLTFDANARGQRFAVSFSLSDVTGAAPNAAPDAAPHPTPVPTHMKERVPRPEMALRPLPPRPEMAPRPPKGDKGGSF